MYNGCPSDDLAKELKSISDAKRYLKDNGINITYFPNGCFYVGFSVSADNAPKIITDDLKSLQQCIDECISYMKNNHK
jgi:hypothetical protein